MKTEFDRGYTRAPFARLCRDYPGADVYPPRDFRVEWGPVFHRGRLDGSARVLVLGQDPGAHECVVRRILVGEAGQRVQGLLARLGIERSYVMVNAFLYSVYGQGGGERHKNDPAVAAYRNRWLDALLVRTKVEAVLALGKLADHAWSTWKATPAGSSVNVAYQAITHPTYPESAAASGRTKKADAMREMLARWNEALRALAPAIAHPDVRRELVPYGAALDKARDLAGIPARDLPAGLPAWMRSLDAWAARLGPDAESKRATIVIEIPKRHRPWLADERQG